MLPLHDVEATTSAPHHAALHAGLVPGAALGHAPAVPAGAPWALLVAARLHAELVDSALVELRARMDVPFESRAAG